MARDYSPAPGMTGDILREFVPMKSTPCRSREWDRFQGTTKIHILVWDRLHRPKKETPKE